MKLFITPIPVAKPPEYSLLKIDENRILMECESNSLYSHTTMDSDFFHKANNEEMVQKTSLL
jgi:hypothetical protein